MNKLASMNNAFVLECTPMSSIILILMCWM